MLSETRMAWGKIFKIRSIVLKIEKYEIVLFYKDC